MASEALLTISFVKVVRSSPCAWWEAKRRTGGKIRGGYMPVGRGIIPHDLVHYATEAHFGIEDGFWGLLARGATFRRGTVQTATRPGRALIARNRAALDAAERLGNHHHGLWRDARPTPVAAAFEALAERWRPLADGGCLTVQWPPDQQVDRRAVRRR